jgi:hypothetical protein
MLLGPVGQKECGRSAVALSILVEMTKSKFSRRFQRCLCKVWQNAVSTHPVSHIWADKTTTITKSAPASGFTGAGEHHRSVPVAAICQGTGSEIPRKPGSMLGACVRVTNVGSEEFDEVHRRALASGRAERG